MTQRAPVGLPVWLWVVLCGAVGALVRLYYFDVKAGIHYPDEIFQYVEPPFHKIHGFAWLPWEYERGVRNWVLPGYYGALLELGAGLGLSGWGLHRFLALQNAALSLLIVPAGFRLGVAVGRGDARQGVLLALALGSFPLFGYFAPHTLSEVHGLLLTTWAYALWMEQVAFPDHHGRCRKACLVGILLGAAFIVRYTLIAFVPLVLLDYNFRVRFRELFAATCGFGAMVLLLGFIDKLTWGSFLHSFVEYADYNFIEGGASEHGVMPRDFYWTVAFGERLGFGAHLLLVPACLVFWRHWRMLLSWGIVLAVFSMIEHKEERFLLSIWPFVWASAISGALALADGLRHVRRLARSRYLAPLRAGAVALLVVCVCVLSFYGTEKLPMRWKAGIFRAQSWIGQQGDASGVLLDDPTHLNGGYFLLARNIPQASFDADLLSRRVFNYVAVYEPWSLRWMGRNHDFAAVARFEDVTVYRRAAGSTGDAPRR